MPVGELCTGFGTTITFATSGFTANIYSISRTGGTRKAIDKTHMTSPDNRMQFCPSPLVDEGTYELELDFDPQTSVPIDQDKELITITYPLAPGALTRAKDEFSGFVTNAGQRIPLDDRMTQTVTLKITGKVTRTIAT